MSHQLIHLASASCSVLIEAELGKMPVWRHLGGRLHTLTLLSAWPQEALRRLPPGSMDRLSGLPLWPGALNGLPDGALLSAHRNGRDAVHELLLSELVQVSAQSVCFKLLDRVAGLSGEITLHLDPDTEILSIATVVRNVGNTPLDVAAFSNCTVPLQASMSELATFYGQWSHEFQWAREGVPRAGWSRSVRDGRSSHEAPPFCFALCPHTTDHSGPVIAAALACSSNHHFEVSVQDDGSRALRAGPWLAPGEITLAPGESLSAPTLLICASQMGLNGASAALHQCLRTQAVPWPSGGMRLRPVHLNTWEAVYFDHNIDALMELASAGAALGVERFILDDGWFPKRHNDQAGLGNWWPDPAKYPIGLAPLIAHVNALGMEFGLWVEPEMVNPDSDLYRAHPEWVLQIAGRPAALGRYQLVLDLTRSAVTDYLFHHLNALLSQHPIAYLKWDMNRNLAQAGDALGRMAYQAQVPALYALMDRLRAAHPHLEIESCASGGGRADYGVLQHSHRLWTSDNNDATSRVAIQSGALRVFPPELLGAHVGPAPAHATGRSQSMAFRCAVACFGHMGVEADVRQLSTADRQTLSEWIAFHKQWRSVIHAGQFSQGRTAQGQVWWLAALPKRALLAVFTTHPPDVPHTAPLQLPAFRSDHRWRVRLVREAGQARARNEAPAPWLNALRNAGVEVSGDELREIGVPLPTMNPESALYFSFERSE
jgi:alpha-galactosidase